jgi:hypothetical protein
MMCEWGHANPAEWGAELALANSWRTGNDLMPLYPCARTCPSSFFCRHFSHGNTTICQDRLGTDMMNIRNNGTVVAQLSCR